jgi:hypothetical protein
VVSGISALDAQYMKLEWKSWNWSLVLMDSCQNSFFAVIRQLGSL